MTGWLQRSDLADFFAVQEGVLAPDTFEGGSGRGHFGEAWASGFQPTGVFQPRRFAGGQRGQAQHVDLESVARAVRGIGDGDDAQAVRTAGAGGLVSMYSAGGEAGGRRSVCSPRSLMAAGLRLAKTKRGSQRAFDRGAGKERAASAAAKVGMLRLRAARVPSTGV